MSTIIMNKCWPLKMSPAQKSVLISLADNSSDEGFCWPSVKTISKRTCLSERSVQRAINWLEERGLLKRDLRHKRSTMYVFDLDLLENYKPNNIKGDTLTGDTVTHSTPSECPIYPVTVTPRTIIEPSIEPSLKNNKRAARLPDDFVMPENWIDIAKTIKPELSRQEILNTRDSFIDYWLADASAKAIKRDWLAAWRFWIRNKWAKPQGAIQPKKTALNFDNTDWIDGVGELL